MEQLNNDPRRFDNIEPEEIMERAVEVKEALLSGELRRHTIDASSHQLMVQTVSRELGLKPSSELHDPLQLEDSRAKLEPVIKPDMLMGVLPPSQASKQTTYNGRRQAESILKHENDKLMVVVGPCSIHDMQAALEYAAHIVEWQPKYPDLAIYMRYYTEKPRTPTNEKGKKPWKGVSYDPRLDGSDDINLGVVLSYLGARQITQSGVALATERLHANTPQYLSGLVAIDSVGARDSSSQGKYEYGSATSSVIGYKNNLLGEIEPAVLAAASARTPHSFIGMNMDGAIAGIFGEGNPYSFVILRGGTEPNYSAQYIEEAKSYLDKHGLEPSLMIDASHGNSYKQANRQIEVITDVCDQMVLGEMAIRGVMIESNLRAGRQDHAFKQGSKTAYKKLDELEYGVSITDECVDLDTTKNMLAMLQEAVVARRDRAQAEGLSVAPRRKLKV